MKYTLHQMEDLEDMREIHRLAFAGDSWPGDDHVYWLAERVDGMMIGFCSAKIVGDTVFLSRAAVIKEATGNGVHRAMIAARVRWAKARGARIVVTYTSLRNYETIVNLVRAGFKFHSMPKSRRWAKFHLMYYQLRELPKPLSERFNLMELDD